jgi:hypothetical protein
MYNRIFRNTLSQSGILIERKLAGFNYSLNYTMVMTTTSGILELDGK